MGCRGIQSLVVCLTIYNFLTLLLSAAALFVFIVVAIAVRGGEYALSNVVTYRVFLINQVMTTSNYCKGANLGNIAAVGMAVICVALFTALYGFILSCCRCKGSPKATKAYTGFITINTILHMIIVIAGIVAVRNSGMLMSHFRGATANVQNNIDVIVNEDGVIDLNNPGKLFQALQFEYQCCGVNKPDEWMNVEWFRTKYQTTSIVRAAVNNTKITFPCSPFGYPYASTMFKCEKMPQPDCTTQEPFFSQGCAEPLFHNIDCCLHHVTCFMGLLLLIHFFGLICSSIYTHRVARETSPSFEGVMRNSASRSSVVSTQALMPYLESHDFANMDSDELAQMCFEIISKQSK